MEQKTSISQWHRDDASPDDAKKVMAYVVDAAESTRKTSGGEGAGATVFMIKLADNSAPIKLECWREEAERLSYRLAELETSESKEDLLVQVTNFTVSTTPNATLPLQTFRATRRTQLDIVDQCRQAEVTSRMASTKRDPSLLTREFAAFSGIALPFVTNVSGVIRSCSATYESQAGTVMKNFLLVDKKNKAIACIAFGTWADDAVLEENAEVLSYYVSGRAGRRSEDKSKLWIYDDAHAVLLRKNVAAFAGQQVEIMMGERK